MFIKNDQVTEIEVHKFVADASDLGFPVGKFEEVLETNLGNKLPLVAHSEKTVNGEFAGIVYRQKLGCIELIVFND